MYRLHRWYEFAQYCANWFRVHSYEWHLGSLWWLIVADWSDFPMIWSPSVYHFLYDSSASPDLSRSIFPNRCKSIFASKRSFCTPSIAKPNYICAIERSQIQNWTDGLRNIREKIINIEKLIRFVKLPLLTPFLHASKHGLSSPNNPSGFLHPPWGDPIFSLAQ
jgi:hypothetical protein